MLDTEKRNPRSTHIDTMSTRDMLKIMSDENFAVARAVEEALPSIAAAVDRIADALKKGGRLIYVGVGSSGRLGVLDAAECPPTYGVGPDKVIGVMAGGTPALVRAAEGMEDSAEAGEHDIMAVNVSSHDMVVGISAAGGAAYVVSAMRYASRVGAFTVALTANRGSAIDVMADQSIVVATGAEVVTGSTRMKAGTATKIVLNMLSTAAMIKNGKVYENMMINVRPTNAKLTQRVINITCEISGASREDAKKALNEVDWDIRRACELLKNK